MIGIDRWNDLNSINQDGKRMLETMRQPLFKALVRQGYLHPHEIGRVNQGLKNQGN